MHGGVHPREVWAPHGPRVARDGVRKKQLLDHDIIRLVGCVPQPPDSVADSRPDHTSINPDRIQIQNKIRRICNSYMGVKQGQNSHGLQQGWPALATMAAGSTWAVAIVATTKNVCLQTWPSDWPSNLRNKSHTSHGQRPGLKRNKSKEKLMN